VKLFEIVPNNFFNIFTSSYRDIYVEAIHVIWKEYKGCSYILTRGQCQGLLYTYFDMRLYDFNDDEENDGIDEKDMSGKTNRILRKLIKHGWIEENDELEELETYINIPSYAVEILEAIDNILNPINNETDKCVTNVYLNIKAIDTEKFNEWLFFENAYQNTLKLSRLLQDILHSIKIYYSQLLKQPTLSELFSEHFNEYIESIIYKKYHSLKTEDNLYKYRTEIVKKANALLYDDEIQSILINQIQKRNGISEDDARYKVFTNLEEIKDIFENIDSRIKQIDRKHDQYLRTTIDRMNYLKSRGKDFKGNLINILKALGNSKDMEPYIDVVNDNIRINLVSSISEKSIYRVKSRRSEFVPQPLQLDAGNNENMEFAKCKIIDEQKNRRLYMYSDKYIEEFLEERLNSKSEFNTKDIEINNDIEFIKLVLALKVARKQKSKYTAEILDVYVVNSKYRVPEIIFRRIQ